MSAPGAAGGGWTGSASPTCLRDRRPRSSGAGSAPGPWRRGVRVACTGPVPFSPGHARAARAQCVLDAAARPLVVSHRHQRGGHVIPPPPPRPRPRVRCANTNTADGPARLPSLYPVSLSCFSGSTASPSVQMLWTAAPPSPCCRCPSCLESLSLWPSPSSVAHPSSSPAQASLLFAISIQFRLSSRHLQRAHPRSIRRLCRHLAQQPSLRLQCIVRR